MLIWKHLSLIYTYHLSKSTTVLTFYTVWMSLFVFDQMFITLNSGVKLSDEPLSIEKRWYDSILPSSLALIQSSFN